MQDSQGGLLIVVLIVSIIIFLVCREVICWYFKINELNKKIDTTNNTLADIRDLLARTAEASAPPPAPMQPGPVMPSSLKGISPPLVKPGNTP